MSLEGGQKSDIGLLGEGLLYFTIQAGFRPFAADIFYRKSDTGGEAPSGNRLPWGALEAPWRVHRGFLLAAAAGQKE